MAKWLRLVRNANAINASASEAFPTADILKEVEEIFGENIQFNQFRLTYAGAVDIRVEFDGDVRRARIAKANTQGFETDAGEEIFKTVRIVNLDGSTAIAQNQLNLEFGIA